MSQPQLSTLPDNVFLATNRPVTDFEIGKAPGWREQEGITSQFIAGCMVLFGLILFSSIFFLKFTNPLMILLPVGGSAFMFLLAYLLIQGGLVVRKIMKEGKVVAGTVLNSTVEVSTGGRTSSYLLRIEYEFIVPGEIYRLNGTYTKSYPILLKKPDPVEPGTPVAVVFLTNSKYTLL